MIVERLPIENCTGCTACYSICPRRCIDMRQDVLGFLYPYVDTSVCIECKLCEEVCPALKDRSGENENNKIYACFDKNEERRLAASSGGIFYLLCEYVIRWGGVVYGASYDDDMSVKHTMASTLEETCKFRGSKYVQSDIRGIFPSIKANLKSGRIVLFSGTPCQIAGIYGFLGNKHYPNLYTVDLLCHGIPSPAIFRDWVGWLSRNNGKRIAAINMKDKAFGWGYQRPRVYFADGTELFDVETTNLLNRIFYSSLCLRSSCYTCKYTNFNRCGDLTIGDFWGIDKCNPELDKKNGVSLVIVNSSNGASLWNNIASQCYSAEKSRQEALQQSLSHNVPKPAVAERFRKDYGRYSFERILKRYFGYGFFNHVKSSIIYRLTKIIRVK